MESLVHNQLIAAVPAAKRASTWRDLREWLALLQAHGQLKLIDAPVDLDEELSAVTYVAAQQETSPALLFRNIAGDRLGASVLTNMLGASKERYALAVGLYGRPGKQGRLDREAWWREGKPCEVVAVYGIDPVLFMVAAQSFNYKLSELEIAGGIMGHPLELTQAEFVSLPIPARAEIVIEGLLHAGDTEMEGPLGEFTGAYGNERAQQPVIEVMAIHHRKAP